MEHPEPDKGNDIASTLTARNYIKVLHGISDILHTFSTGLYDLGPRGGVLVFPGGYHPYESTLKEHAACIFLALKLDAKYVTQSRGMSHMLAIFNFEFSI